MQHARAIPFILLLAACGGDDDATSGPDGSGGEAGRPDAAGGGGEEAACGPWNCDGCCDGDSCRAGDGDDECGAGGAACQACGRWGACGEAAVCELAAGTRWDVIVDEAAVSAVNHGGTDWDGDGDLPDVYVRATLADPATGAVESERTDAHETLTPTWNETLFADLPAGALEGMQIELFDSDGNADDSFGVCTAAVRLEDAAAGTLDVDCPYSLSSGTAEVPPRAGWILRLRLEPRSDGRPDAPPLDRHASPAAASAPGSCVITWSRDGAWEATYSYDDWGREIRRHEVGGPAFDWECTSEDVCEVATGWPLVRRMEPGPFGWRVRVEDGDFDSRGVNLHDSLGRLVAQKSYDASGRREATAIYSYTSMRKVHHIWWVGVDDEIDTTEFDERGSPLVISGRSMVQKIDLDADGLPVRYRISESSLPEFPVDSAWDVTYDGSGCAAALAAEVTNGPLLD